MNYDDILSRIGVVTCCTPQQCPYPIEEPKAAYGNSSITGLAPVKPQVGNPTDKISKIFKNREYLDGSLQYHGISQSLGNYVSVDETVSWENIYTENYSGWNGATGGFTHEGYINTRWDLANDQSCEGQEADSGSECFVVPTDDKVDWVYEEDVETCTESEYTFGRRGTAKKGSPLSLKGCPGPFGPDGACSVYYDLTMDESSGMRLSNGKTEADLIAEAKAKATNHDQTYHQSEMFSNWPTISEFPDWPPCSEQNPPSATAGISLMDLIVRMKLPSKVYDPGGRESADYKGDYYKITYDIVEYPPGVNDPENPDQPPRSWYATDAVIEWHGPGDPSNPESWYLPDIYIPPPDIPGVRRLVNLRAICRVNWDYGEAPPLTWGTKVEKPTPP